MHHRPLVPTLAATLVLITAPVAAQDYGALIQQQMNAMDVQAKKMDLALQAMKNQMELVFMREKKESEDSKETAENEKKESAAPAVAPVINIGGGRKVASIVRDGSGRISGIDISQGE